MTLPLDPEAGFNLTKPVPRPVPFHLYTANVQSALTGSAFLLNICSLPTLVPMKSESVTFQSTEPPVQTRWRG